MAVIHTISHHLNSSLSLAEKPRSTKLTSMNADVIPRRIPAGRKRPIDAVTVPTAVRKLRSKLPRRKRSAFPIFNTSSYPDDDEISSSSCFRSGLSTVSSLLPAGAKPSKPPIAPVPAIAVEPSRPITRWYIRQKKRQLQSELESAPPKQAVKQTAEKALEISESSCVESISELPVPKPAISESSVVRSSADPCDLDSDLACSEELSERSSGRSEYSTCNEMTLSDFESELFHCGSSFSSSDHTSSLYADSSDDFSFRSPDPPASPMFAFFLDLARQLVRSPPREIPDSSSGSQDRFPIEFTVLRFEVEEDEECYRGLRRRERRDAAPRGYAEHYSSETDYGDLVLEQRLLMVNWIVEYAKLMELKTETLFLGVSLMDRFLSRGYFKTQKNLQLLGIACITLATRIEENQPYNSIRRRSFAVESNVYTRLEVVAMEWLVMNVLKFQCFPPTTLNFLWFYLKAARADAKVESLARNLAVLSLLDHEHLSFWPSSVAAGLVILASLATDHDSSCQLVMETHVRTRNDDLPECIQSLEWLIKYAL